MMKTPATLEVTDCAPTLTPKVAPWMRTLTETDGRVRRLSHYFGSPFHIVVDSEFGRNAADLLQPLRDRGISGGLFFARKANKLPWFVTAARQEGLGVDTASLAEVEETLALGLPGEKVIITAIGKSEALINRALMSGCLLVIDNDDELSLVRAMASTAGCKARIGLRFAGFEVGERFVFSRFGFSVNEAGELLRSVVADPSLSLEILHAHLDRYDVDERAQAAYKLLELCDYARELGGEIRGIDLGGGILIRYLEHESEWNAFNQALLDSVAGKRKACTFRGDGLGFLRAGDEIVGQADLYPAWNNLSKERFVAAVLDRECGGRQLYKQIGDRGMVMYFEPGRALLDNTGMTVARVVFRKRDTLGNLLIGVAMNRMNLRPFRAEFSTDPLILSDGERQPLNEGAYLVGCLCSESDLIYRRKLKLDRLPEPGDLVCFFNTAGYLAHHLEVGTHGDPLPSNVLLDSQSLEVLAKI